jgi:eukaryotic-like serine/threonine-protein kinase
MSIAAGTRLGTYTISTLIGAGGMGEVYAAHDSKLERNVAIKVLPEQFARDQERLARFQREAKLLASLNHPNIATIHGLEQSGDTHYLVMELVPGETLRDRVLRDGRVPVEEALAIARQIAEALEAAHESEKGIIHRDLKPANVKVTPDGKVKVLDFGLAKAFAADATGQDFSNSPTLSVAPTMHGVIMGTASYMSPEQARGRPVTKATDIFAFGAVLYELLTGVQAFPGEDVGDILATVVKTEPDWSKLPEDTPPAIRTLLKRCLRKERRQRLGDAGAVRIEIEDALAWMAEGGAGATATTAPIGRLTLPGRVAWSVAAIAIVIGALAMGAFMYRQPAPAEPQAFRFSVGPPQGTNLDPNPHFLTISPDGTKLAFIATDSSGKGQLWVRALDSEAAQPLAGTDDPTQPFWSADSRFLAFYARDGKLKKVAASGGPVQTITDAVSGANGSWSRDGIILFAPAAGGGTTAAAARPGATIRRVSSAGGESQPVTALDESRQETAHYWPHFLPDGKHFLYLALSSNPEKNAIFVGSLDSPEKKLLLNAASNVVYVSPGYLLFNREGTLMAQPFDAERLELAGEEVPIAEDVQFNAVNMRAAFAASANGVLAYRIATSASSGQLVWFDRSGKQTVLLGDPNAYGGDVELSPDGKRAAVSIVDQVRRTEDLWLYDVGRGLKTRFTFDPGQERNPIWSLDGSRIVFSSTRKGRGDLYQKASDNSGTEEVFFEDNLDKFGTGWTPDGRFFLYSTNNTGNVENNDVLVLPLSGDRKPVPFQKTEFREGFARFSPDGRWVAYTWYESGLSQVYVAPFPGPGGKWLVSTAGGRLPRWRRDGTEIFYLAPDNTLMAAAVNGRGSSFAVGAVRPLFETRATGARYSYDVSADGQRFLINTALEQAASAPITVVVNWAAGVGK